MKKLTTTLSAVLLILLTQTASAQQFTYELGNSSGQGIEFSLSRSNITIEGYEGTEIIIENNSYKSPPERAEGLRPLYGAGEDNTGIGLYVEEEDGQLKFIQATANGGSYVVKVPNRIRVMIEEVNWGNGDISVSNHNGEIEIQSKIGDVVLKNVTGPVIVNSTSGNAEIVFSRVSASTPSSVSLVSGFLDVTLPASTSADLQLSSLSGEIYTNLDLEIENGKEGMMRLGGGKKITGTLNGGGAELKFKAISGDIFLRKAE